MPTLSRRQFGSLTAATVVASLLRIRPEHDLHRAVNQFCRREPSGLFDHALLFRSDIGIEGVVMPLAKASARATGSGGQDETV